MEFHAVVVFWMESKFGQNTMGSIISMDLAEFCYVRDKI